MLIGFQTIGLLPGRLDTSDLIMAFLTLYWFITVITTPGYRIVVTPLLFLNLGLLAFAFLSAANGGIMTLVAMMPLLKAVFVAFFIVDVVRDKERILFFFKALLVITTVSAVIGILQEILYLSYEIILAHYDSKRIYLMLEHRPSATFLRVVRMRRTR